jgi:hypothetical protein
MIYQGGTIPTISKKVTVPIKDERMFVLLAMIMPIIETHMYNMKN